MPNRQLPLSWTPVTSSNVDAIRYGRAEEALYVRFKGGAIYWYECPEEFFWRMLESPSKGKFVHEQLKGKFAFGRV